MGSIKKKHSFWWDNSPPDFALQPQLPKYADVVIVGAGFAGISTAYWLKRLISISKKKALRIIVLDEAPHAGFKASGRMNGSVYLGSHRSAKYMADLLGKKTAAKLFAYSNQNNILLENFINKGIDCDPEFNGGLRMASTAKEAVELDDSAELLREWGFYPARFDHSQSDHVMVAPHTNGSLFVPGEGLIDPFAFVNRLARILRRNGIWVVYGTRVECAETSEEFGPQLHLSNGHVLSADKIIHTTPTTAPWDRIEEHLICRREHVARTEAFVEELEDMPLPLMPVELNGGLDSIRIHDQAVVMTGGKAGLKNDPELNVMDDTGSNDRVSGNLDKTMMHHLPVTNYADTTHTWTYIEMEMDDGLPLMGELPNAKGHYVNIAHGRNKFGLAFLGAKNVAEKALRKKVSNPEFSIFAPKRLIRGE